MRIYPQNNNKNTISARKGFALIATISVVVLLALISLALISLSTVSIRSNQTDANIATARANARMGLMVAINQLQYTLGPDQRVTAPADLKNPTAQNRKWIGVYGNQQVANYSQNPAAIPNEPYDPVLLNWLVSGNETVNFTTSITAGSFGQITNAPNSLPFNPTDTLEKFAHLVAGGSVIDNSDYVTAPIVAVTDDSGNTTGGYAYWAGDEGMKARVDLRENFRLQATPAKIDEGKAFSFMVAQRNGIETISRDNDETLKIGDDFDPDSPDIDKLISSGQFPLLASAIQSENIQNHKFHDITSSSKSVIADTYAGGLKQDMNALIYGGHGPTDKAPIFTPTSESEFGLPTWGRIRSWANLTAPHSTPPPVMPASAVQPYDPTGSEIRFGPVILLSQLALGLELDSSTPNAVRVMLYPALILWNPYTVSIPAIDYEWGVRYTPGQTNNDELRVQMSDLSNTWVNLGSCNLSGGNPTMTAGNDFFRFLVEGQEIPAGEAHIYLAESPASGQYSPGATKLVRAPDTSPIGYLARSVSTDTTFTYDPSSFNITSNADSELKVRLDSSIANSSQSGMTSGNRAEAILTIPGELTNGYNQDTPVFQALLDMNFIGSSATVDTPVTISGLRALSTTGSGPMYMTNSTLLMEARGNPASNRNAVGAMHSGNQGQRNRWIAAQNPLAPYVKRTAKEINAQGGAFSHGSAFDGLNSQASRRMLTNSRVQNYFAGIGGSPGSPFATDTLRRTARQAPLLDILSDTIPLISLGQLQHAQLDIYAFGHTYTFGNAGANVNIPRASHFVEAQIAQPGNAPTNYTDSLYDMSWHVNRALWDRYFLSTAPTTLSQTDIDDNEPLPNARMEYQGNPKLQDINPVNPDALQKAAANLMIRGGFNINSTSVDAWRAMLTGTNKLTVPSTLAHPQYSTTPLNAMMPRFSRDVRLNDSNSDEGLTNMWSASSQLYSNLYRGNRELLLFSDSENSGESPEQAQARLHLVAQELAEKIVEEIRLRGPFVSLSDFINRRLSNTDEGIRGTLMAAIDKMENNHVNPPNSFQTTNVIAPNNGFSGWDPEHYLGTPSSEATSVSQMKAAMAPKHLTQADILTTLGPSLSARSDTFKIRSYGEAVDGNGNVTSQAWCEAIVQRTPDYIDPADEASTVPADLISEANKILGRRFEIKSFRWLSKEEI